MSAEFLRDFEMEVFAFQEVFYALGTPKSETEGLRAKLKHYEAVFQGYALELKGEALWQCKLCLRKIERVLQT